MSQGEGEGEFHLHAPGELRGPAVEGKLQHLEQAIVFRRIPGRVKGRDESAQLPGVHPGVVMLALGNVADAPLQRDRGALRLLTEKLDLAL